VLPSIEALQPARAGTGAGAGPAFSDDPFARMLEQSRQATRLEARRRQERDIATANATATTPDPAAETAPGPGPGPGQAQKTAPGSAAGARKATQDTGAATVAGADDVSPDVAKDPRIASGSPGVRRNLGLDPRPTLNRVAARNAGQPAPEAGGVERRLGDMPGEDAAGPMGKAARSAMASHADGQGLNPSNRPVALPKGNTFKTTLLSVDAVARGDPGSGHPGAGAGADKDTDAGKLQLQATAPAAAWQPATPARLQAAFSDLATSGQAFADAAAFTLADPATTLERAASAVEAGFGQPMPASPGLSGDVSGAVSGVLSGVISGANPADTSTLTATATQATLQGAPGSHSFGLQLGTQVTLWLKDGIQNAQLQLNPAELGPVMVAIKLDGQAAQVSFSAEHAATRQALEQALPTLAGTLADAGFTLAGGGVFDQARQGSQPGRDEAPLGRGFGSRDGQALNGSKGAGSGTNPRTSLPPRQRGMVDLVA